MFRTLLILAVILLVSISNLYAHGNKHAEGENSGAASYVEELSGMQANFSLEGIRKLNQQGQTLYECSVSAQLNSTLDAPFEIADVALRFTSGHEKFGNAYALVLDPDTGIYRKKVFLQETGEQHFLLVVIDSTGKKREFHFHHTF